MPSLSDSRVTLDPRKYRPLQPAEGRGGAMATPEPTPSVPPAPAWPPHLLQSTVMISSLPSISTSADGLVRQFYGGANVPTRRLIVT